jgi:D-3-phosphoglycerate dehydrogenase
VAQFKVVVTDQVFPDVEVERELLASIDAELEVADGSPEDVAKRTADADALLNTYLPVDAGLIGGLSRCRIIARYGIGVDNVDLEAAKGAGIVVTNVPDYCVEEVSAHASAMLLALLRKLPDSDRLVREGAWSVDGVRPLRRISGLTAGLVGYGRIARRVADVLHALGMRVVVYDPYVQPSPDGPELVELDELLRTADAISVHAPLTPDTRGMIGTRELGLVRPDAVLVNTSRGPLVDNQALFAALREGRLGAAGLDVFDPEPPDPSSFADVPNLLTSPHTAYYSEEALRESQHKAATQIVKVLTGGSADYQVNR